MVTNIGTISAPRAQEHDRLDPEYELARLMEQFESRLFGWVLSIVGDADAAMDCVQDTFLRAYQSLRRDKPVNKQWLYKVSHNLAIDEIRRRGRTSNDFEALEHMEDGTRADRDFTVAQTLERLPDLDRTVLYLFNVAGFRTDEIGHMLGVRGPAVRQRLYRAREKFRTLYAEAA